jgi:hypothetical protein
MSEKEDTSENPILRIVKRNRFIYWLIAFLALAGGALQFGEQTWKAAETLFKPEPANPEREINIRKASELGIYLSLVALRPHGLESEFPDHSSKVRDLLDDLKLPPRFKEYNYSGDSYSNPSSALWDLATAISDAKGMEAEKHFLFSYWLSTAMQIERLRPQIGLQAAHVEEALKLMMLNLPAGIEAPRLEDHVDLCIYYYRHFPYPPTSLPGASEIFTEGCKRFY